jgi:hypothetical protein
MSRDTALLILGGPAGPIKDGEVQTVEIGRLAMTLETLRSVAALIEARLAETRPAPRKPAPPRSGARRDFRDQAEAEGCNEDERQPIGKFTTH